MSESVIEKDLQPLQVLKNLAIAGTLLLGACTAQETADVPNLTESSVEADLLPPVVIENEPTSAGNLHRDATMQIRYRPSGKGGWGLVHC